MNWRQTFDQSRNQSQSHREHDYQTGLTINTELDINLYEKGIHVGDGELEMVGVQKNLSEAANLYQTVVENYGDSEYAYEAQSRLGSIQNQ